MDSKNPPSQVDHGVDVIGDEWEEPEEENPLEKILPIPKMEKKIVPEHPYCTNWPVGEKKNEDI
jgi:hypothetical protein